MKKLAIAALLLVASLARAEEPIVITTIPATPLIEKTRRGQALNFDLVIANRGSEALELTEIHATGAGVVVAAAGDREDNTPARRVPMQFEEVIKDLTLIMGNYAVIDHGNGEFSVFAHMKQGSVIVKAGDRVRQGQTIGEMGFSGDAIFPHLHYQLQRDAHHGEGLPSTFRRFKRLTGSAWTSVKRGAVDSGDVVETTR